MNYEEGHTNYEVGQTNYEVGPNEIWFTIEA